MLKARVTTQLSY